MPFSRGTSAVICLKEGRSSEAGLKYLLLGAISSAVTLYGMAYLFGIAGSTSLEEIGRVVSEADGNTRSALVLATVFLAAGFGFKMAIVPFQMWVPDVYEGAPTPVTAYLSVGSKAAGFAVVMRVFLTALRRIQGRLQVLTEQRLEQSARALQLLAIVGLVLHQLAAP